MINSKIHIVTCRTNHIYLTLRNSRGICTELCMMYMPIWCTCQVVFNFVVVDNMTSFNMTNTIAIHSQAYHYNDVIMSAMASQITTPTIVYSTVYSGEDQRKHQRSASLAFVRGIHRWPVNSPHKGPVTRKCFHLMTSSWCARVTRKFDDKSSRIALMSSL